MPSIKFNQLTREIEMKGPESFIESNFNKIQDLLVESFGVKKMVSRESKTIQEPISVVKMQESQAATEIKRHELSEASPISTAAKSFMLEFPHELKAKRPPLRKYIRKEGTPGHQRTVVEVAEQKPAAEISIASLREKFGLSESKIGGVIRDAEKFGKIKRVVNGSYAWA
jgi:hypothetical protein